LQLIDEFWLKEINEDRRKKDLGEVSSTMFEKIFDRLEKEWFDLVSVSLKLFLQHLLTPARVLMFLLKNCPL